jgi:hypothetical protein
VPCQIVESEFPEAVGTKEDDSQQVLNSAFYYSPEYL